MENSLPLPTEDYASLWTVRTVPDDYAASSPFGQALTSIEILGALAFTRADRGPYLASIIRNTLKRG